MGKARHTKLAQGIVGICTADRVCSTRTRISLLDTLCGKASDAAILIEVCHRTAFLRGLARANQVFLSKRQAQVAVGTLDGVLAALADRILSHANFLITDKATIFFVIRNVALLLVCATLCSATLILEDTALSGTTCRFFSTWALVQAGSAFHGRLR